MRPSISDIISSEISMKAAPMIRRPNCLTLRDVPLRNRTPPTMISTGVSHDRSSDSTLATTAEPKLAPSMTPMPVPPVISPLPANPAASSATAVELCNAMAMMMPAPAAASLLPLA